MADDQHEFRARAYCCWLRADPDALVAGWLDGLRYTQPRWCWYVGADLPAPSRTLDLTGVRL